MYGPAHRDEDQYTNAAVRQVNVPLHPAAPRRARMSLKLALAGALLLAAVLAPVEVILAPAAGQTVDLNKAEIVDVQRGSCGEHKGVVALRLADGTVLYLGENHRAIKAEFTPGGDRPTVTFGTWDEKGQLVLHPKTKHVAGENDELCSDLFSQEA